VSTREEEKAKEVFLVSWHTAKKRPSLNTFFFFSRLIPLILTKSSKFFNLFDSLLLSKLFIEEEEEEKKSGIPKGEEEEESHYGFRMFQDPWLLPSVSTSTSSIVCG
jgi:hypothetical protein